MATQALSPASSGEDREDRSAETDDESLGDSEAKPKKLKKKKKKVKKEGEDGTVTKKKKKKKKKPLAEEAAEADGEHASESAGGGTANTEPSTPSGTGTDEEEGLSKAGLKMPVRRQSNMLDEIEISDVESDADDDDATAKASGHSNKTRAHSTGTYDKQTHVRFLQAQKAKAEAEAAARGQYASPPARVQDDYDHDSGSDSSPPKFRQRPVRARRGANEQRYKSNSLGALDKKKHQMIMRKKQSIRIPAGSRRHMRYMSSDDDNSDVEGNGQASSSQNGSDNEGEMTLSGGGGGRNSGDDIPSRPVRVRGAGAAKYRSNSVGILDKNAQDRFLDRASEDDARSQDGGSSDEDGGGNRPPRRPPRTRRTSNQPRYRSTSTGVLDKNARDIYNSKAPPPGGSNFLKPRKRSAGAIKAKETMQRSAEESSLHQAQPNIRVALPRLRSVGALNARGSGSNSRRSSRDRYQSDSDTSDSPKERKVQSERLLKTKSINSDDDSSSSDGSSESDAVHVASAPLPKSFRPTRNWADASKQLDQLPSVKRTSSAQSVNQKPAATDAIAPPPMTEEDDGDIWTETLKGVAEKKKKKKKVKKGRNESDDSQSEHKPKTKSKKKDKVRKSSAPGLETGSYH